MCVSAHAYADSISAYKTGSGRGRRNPRNLEAAVDPHRLYCLLACFLRLAHNLDGFFFRLPNTLSSLCDTWVLGY